MKAAILYNSGGTPIYAEYPDPIAKNDEKLVQMKAASIKNLDKMKVKGSHYDGYQNFPAIVGVDGVGVLEDGSRVYINAPEGLMAEKVVISKKWMIPVPGTLDDVTAAAIPNPAISAWLSLELKGQLKKGDCVLIMGATGITGKLAVQLAHHMGAGKIIVLGRNEGMLEKLKDEGANVTIPLNQSDEMIKQAIQKEKLEHHIDIVIDYLWGKPAELLLEVLTGHDLHAESQVTRYIQVGEMAGSTIQLAGATLRSSAIELSGQGGGSIPKEVLQKIPTIILLKFSGLLPKEY